MASWLDTPNRPIPGDKSIVQNFGIPPYDDVQADPNFNAPNVVTFSKGGVTVAVLEFTYSSGNLVNVSRTS
jgi:hypothetical protein